MVFVNREMESGDTKMVKLAESMLKEESGARFFWREDGTMRFQLEQVVHFLQNKSSGGDLKAAQDLDEINKLSGSLKEMKKKFFAAKDLSTKKKIAAEYKQGEKGLIKLFSSPDDAED